MKARPTFRGVVLRGAAPLRPEGSPGAGSARGPVRVGRQVAGRNGKGVSVITGLPLSGAQLEALATELKKRCGAGGAVRDGSIEIQGEHRDRLVAELCKLGYEARRAGG
ncbi:MAG TPA: stress response translation initiation inhibitor YciH [Steroidobacteraceae bacterium]